MSPFLKDGDKKIRINAKLKSTRGEPLVKKELHYSVAKVGAKNVFLRCQFKVTPGLPTLPLQSLFD